MPEPYSPLRYPGGKARLATFLIRVMEINGLRAPRYIEPYAGGAGAALRLLFEEFVESIVINDADPRVQCFWQAVTKHTDPFLSMLEEVQITVEEWRRQREIYQKCNQRKVLELGFATFFLNRTTRSGIIHNGGPIGGFDQTGKYKIDARFNRPRLVRRIQRIDAYSDRIEVSGEDGLALLKRIDQQFSEERNTFVYLDPPYYAKGAELYLNRLTHDQHVKLANYLRDCRNLPWVMTYDNVEEIQEIYTGFPQAPFHLSYSAYERRRGQELLIFPESLIVSTEAKRELAVAA